MYRIWSEWDMGHEDLIFNTKEDALKYARECFDSWDMDITFEEAQDDNLIYARELTIM